MRITSISIQNFIGARDVSLTLDVPGLIVAGDNGAGKTSIREAIRLAFSGEPARVSLKKEYAQMVSDGAKRGQIELGTDVGGVSVAIPAGTRTVEAGSALADLPGGLIQFVLDAQRFAALPENDRRKILFGLMGVDRSQEEIARRMQQRGIDAKRIGAVLPLLRSGFSDACNEAKGKAREAKGAWRAVTGEDWGSDKSEGWKAAAPEFDAEAHSKLSDELSAASAALSTANGETGRLRGLRQAAESRERRLSELRSTAASHSPASGRVTEAVQLAASKRTVHSDLQRQITELSPQAPKGRAAKKADAVAYWRNGHGELLADRFVNDLTRAEADPEGGYFICETIQQTAAKTIAEALGGKFVEQKPEQASHESEAETADRIARINALRAKAGVAETELRDAEEKLERAKAEVALADKAASDLRAIESIEQAVVTDEEIAAAEAAVNVRHTAVTDLRAKLADLDRAKAARTEAARKTADAAEHHLSVVGWLKVAEALAPDGIPGEMLAEALNPLNEILRTAALRSGWAQATIDPDMTIRAAGRAYHLLSESECWRVDAMLAASIAQLSGLKLLLLDRVDVLSIQHRPRLINWLNAAIAAGELDGALLFGTFKAAPAGLPSNFRSVWLENGRAIQAVEQAVAA